MQIELGHAARKLWTLREDGSFLNHGSYGACPVLLRFCAQAYVVEQEMVRLGEALSRHGWQGRS